MTVPDSDRAGRAPPAPAAVDVLPWPGSDGLRARARAAGRPCLMVVAAGTPPPTDCGRDEDWTSAATAPSDVAARTARLAALGTARPSLPGAVVDQFGDVEVLVFDVLARNHGRAVPNDVLVDVAGSPAELDRVVATLRRHLRPAGFDVLRDRAVALLVVPRSGRDLSRQVERIPPRWPAGTNPAQMGEGRGGPA
jgi:hypothetical protein